MNALVDAIPFDQPESFEFTAENLERAKAHIAKYPPGRQASAVLPLLWIAQYQNDGWLPRAAMDYVGESCGIELKGRTHVLDSSVNDELAGHEGVGVKSDGSRKRS